MFFQKKIALFGVLAFLVACTDYVQQIDDRYGEWDASISSDTVKSSSSIALSSNSVKVLSSGSDMKSSSSSTIALSSSSGVSGPVEVKSGTMTDTRDGQTYKTVTIGTQTWMAENLNFKTDSSFCYNNEVNCAKYGRLYRWAAAVGKSESECGYNYTCSLPSGNIQGVCPNGWHLPSKAEWETLFNAVGGESMAGKVLKSTSGWSSAYNGTDAFGFSALPAGFRSCDGKYVGVGERTGFWSSTETEYVLYGGFEFAYSVVIWASADLTPEGCKSAGLGVRCLKD